MSSPARVTVHPTQRSVRLADLRRVLLAAYNGTPDTFKDEPWPVAVAALLEYVEADDAAVAEVARAVAARHHDPRAQSRAATLVAALSLIVQRVRRIGEAPTYADLLEAISDIERVSSQAVSSALASLTQDDPAGVLAGSSDGGSDVG